jgi:hypothetical protein
MKRVVLTVLLLAALGATATAAGCGGGEDTAPEPEARVLTTGQVVDRFRTQPGQPRLRKAAVPDAAWEQLGLGLDPSQAQLRRYGVFTIYVVKPGRGNAVRSLLSNKETGQPLEPDTRGIYWEFDTLARSWVANTRYGENVVLAWWSEEGERGTDVRWERLHEMLSTLQRG